MKINHLIGVLLAGIVIGCTDKFEDFNTDQKNPAAVPGSALFTSGTKFIADQVNTSSVNENIFKLFAQYWTETTYIDEANYAVVNRGIARSIYTAYYRQGLSNLQEAKKYIETEENPPEVIKNKLAIIELFSIYAYQQLADIFGSVPYKDALNIGNVYPKYDGGLDIYKDLIKRTDAALANLNVNAASFGIADVFYKGNVAAWIKFGYTLKVKMGISLSDVSSETALAKSTVESSYDKAFSSSADDCLVPYQEASPNFNPLYAEIVASGRNDYVIANTFADVLNALNDPRREKYFTEIKDGGYKGGQYGYPSPYDRFSHINPSILEPAFHGIMMTYTELQFYLAEAAARGFSVGKTAADYYAEGIKSSILEWGGSQAQADAYLAQPSVAYSAAQDRSRDGWREKIGTQSWIANYTRGLEAWTTWRRLDYPVFNVPERKASVEDIPTRFTFPVDEQTANGKNYQAAAAALGGDLLTSKIFWDVYNVTKP